MTDTRRDRVARVIETAMREVWNGETLPSPDHVADALLAEGLIAPEGMSADDLEMAAEIVHICGYVPLGIRLRAWASALAVADREATRGVRVGGADRMSAETRETLLAAAALLERDGWCQGWYNDEHGRRCLDEALHVTTTPSLDAYNETRQILLGLLGSCCLAIWNDAPGRTVEEVVALLRTAAESEK